jgi:dihydrofolate reductase
MLLSCLAGPANTLPSPGQLIRAAVAVKTAHRDWKYTYREDEQWFLVDKKGQRVRSAAPSGRKTFDVIMLEGESYRKLVLIDGKPLDAKTEEQVNQDLENERAQRRQQPKNPPAVTKKFTVSPVGVEQLERFFETKVTGEETVLGRKTWRLESIPQRNFPQSNLRPIDKEGVPTFITGVVTWIDQQEGVEIKQTSVFTSAPGDIQVGTELTVEFSKVGEAWLPDTIRARFDYKTGMMQHSYREQDVRSYDYKRFTVDSTIVTP